MEQKQRPNRRKYTDLGDFLRGARVRTNVSQKQKFTVAQIAEYLDVTPGFVYQVEQGIRKPKDGDFGSWASVYGVRYVDMWKCLGRMPMDLVATLRTTEKEPQARQFPELTEIERYEIRPFLEYVRWKISHQEVEINQSENNTTVQ